MSAFLRALALGPRFALPAVEVPPTAASAGERGLPGAAGLPAAGQGSRRGPGGGRCRVLCRFGKTSQNQRRG